MTRQSVSPTQADAIPHIALGSVGSTLDEAWQRLEAGRPPPFWLTAVEQRAGKGRLNRQWISAPGNLYATLALAEPPGVRLSLLPIAVALAIHASVVEALPPQRHRHVSLKWPNDVLIDGAKTCGILIERREVMGRGFVVSIGFGINIAHAPMIEGRQTTCLHEHAKDATVERVFESVQATLNAHLAILAATPHRVVEQWTRFATGLGEPIVIETGTGRVEGTFDHMASDGALMVRRASGVMTAIHTGDVVMRSN